ncbi:MAG: cupin domain-containing protein, partial [Bdellovibrionales bacterium]|nr:cupin domain-containing protein [Bdellovibrionales bacterium]
MRGFIIVGLSWMGTTVQAQVFNLETAPTKTNGKGTFVRYLGTPEFQKTKSAFVAHVTFPPGAMVPEHRDFTEEFLYIIKGSGKIWINDQEYE